MPYADSSDLVMTPKSLDAFGITAKEIQTRRAFLRFTREDEDNLQLIHRLIDPDVDVIIEDFYVHLRRFEELERFLSADKVERLKKTQREYILSLGREADRPAYFEQRLRIGVAHERVGLPQQWYLGAYALLFELIGWRLAVRHAAGQTKFFSLLNTLQKVLTLDSTLAVETYYQATTQRLEHILHGSTEAQQRLREASRRDSLTQVMNRQFLIEALDLELHRSHRFHRPFTLLFVDIDHFKQLNDQHRHAFGDFVLQKMVHLMSEVLRPADVLGRYGGEEFVIGLVETDEAMAQKIAERLRLKVSLTTFAMGSVSASATISIGVATLTPRIRRIEALIEKADRALYRAKEAGRNQVCVSQDAH